MSWVDLKGNLEKLSLDLGDEEKGKTHFHSLILTLIYVLIFWLAISVSFQAVFSMETHCIWQRKYRTPSKKKNLPLKKYVHFIVLHLLKLTLKL